MGFLIGTLGVILGGLVCFWGFSSVASDIQIIIGLIGLFSMFIILTGLAALSRLNEVMARLDRIEHKSSPS